MFSSLGYHATLLLSWLQTIPPFPFFCFQSFSLSLFFGDKNKRFTMAPPNTPQLLKKSPPPQLHKPSKAPSTHASNFTTEPFPWDLVTPPTSPGTTTNNGAKTLPTSPQRNKYKQKWRGSVTTTCYYCPPSPSTDKTHTMAQLEEEGMKNCILITTIISQKSEKCTKESGRR